MKGKKKFKIFVVEDDQVYGKVLLHHLSLNPEYEVTQFTSGKDVLNALYLKPDLISLDLGLPDIDGTALLKKLLAAIPTLSIIVISAQEKISTALELLKLGAKDYIPKDEYTRDLLWKSVINLLENTSLREEISELKQHISGNFSFDKSIIGLSKPIKQAITMAEKATQSKINVSLLGETGTGKEVFARAIHQNGQSDNEPFVAINMASIPTELVESELFGHEKGAFTGAIARKIGKFEDASGGTLFLDEISELDMAIQAKLLRALQEREITPVGSQASVPIDIRLISASNKNLQSEVKEGNFRQDLYFRVMGLPIELPPLRDRGNDILLLAAKFINDFCKSNNLSPIKLSMKAKEKLLGFWYPGNVRELKAVIDLACVLCNDNLIQESDISFNEPQENPFDLRKEKSLREYTFEIISFFLRKNNNNVLKVAKKLHVSKSTIYNFLKAGAVQGK